MTKRAARRTESLRMGSLAAKSEVQADADRLSPKPEARTLLGCMWLQFARAIGGDKSYRVCQNCKRWSEIGGGTHGDRSDKRYCCGTCKAAAHAKKEGQGAPPKQIREEACGYRTEA